ncbi:Panacea domain-containing protein [Alkalinema pantanalense CENA528]|uniref:Panacea domain-containing protein n=1 Tax=Alkalinema pantanalense TaxID=1620705 RepID=UPI003D6EE8FA
MQTLTITAFNIADYFLWLANDVGSFISNLKLQKLVYYAQAWHLALYDRPLFDEDFQAWVHGPVIPELFEKYKHFGWRPIDEDAKIDLPDDIVSHLNDVADEYFRCDAYELEQMTHIEEPWQKARVGLMPDQASTNIIQKVWMQEYYKARVEED